MTDNEETRSYNEILADNKELRKAINAEFARFMFDGGQRYAEQTDMLGYLHSPDKAYKYTIAAWKAQQADND